MVKYSRFVRKTSNGDPIKWIEVLSLDQLPPGQFFRNLIDPSVYYSQPDIEETCNKDLRTPYSTFHSFMKIICTSIVPNTTEYLRAMNKKRTCYEEICEFVMAAMAVVICSGKFQHFKSSVGTLRQSLKTDYGISPK